MDDILVMNGLSSEHGDVLLRVARLYARLGEGEVGAVADHPEIQGRLQGDVDATREFAEYTGFLQRMMALQNSSGAARAREGAAALLELLEEWDARGRGALELPLPLAGELVHALDMHARIGIGQFRIEEHPAVAARLHEEWEAGRMHGMQDTIQAVMIRARTIVMPKLTGGIGHSYGIHSREVLDEARVAWDMMQVARHALSWHRHHAEGGSGPTYQVSFDTPRRSSAESLPSAEVVAAVPRSHAGP